MAVAIGARVHRPPRNPHGGYFRTITKGADMSGVAQSMTRGEVQDLLSKFAIENGLV